MSWVSNTLGIALVIVIVLGATLALCRRYCIGWQWSTRNFWNVYEKWRQRISWLWAPREEKVGLVKAQHPTAHTIPGLYRQTGNASQHLLHSDSDIRLDAQGAFTRFEPVDRDLHPPLSTTASSIPPQPLRPAPQPRPIPRPKPSPLQTSSTVDYLRMQEAGPGPLTPPPSLQRPTAQSRTTGPSIFQFQTETLKSYDDSSNFRFENEGSTMMTENIEMPQYMTHDHRESMLRYDPDGEQKDSFDTRNASYRKFDTTVEATRIRYGVHGVPIGNDDDDKTDSDDCGTSYGSYDIVQRNIRQHSRNESRGSPSSFRMTNSVNAASQTNIESIYGPEELSKILQSTQSLGNDFGRKSKEVQNIEMTPFGNSTTHGDINSPYLFRESQGLQRVSQYIQSLPEIPNYESIIDIGNHGDHGHVVYDDTMEEGMEDMKVSGDSASSPIPPPPAPPDPPQETTKKTGQTTGERIFSALSSVTSQSYIDASEFYNSVRSSVQQVQHFAFSSKNPSMINLNDANEIPQKEEEDDEEDDCSDDGSDIDDAEECKTGSDLYNPELNLKAHWTAQEVFNSLQNPPSSPRLVSQNEHTIYSYMSDPSFLRTSEEIFNSLKEMRKSQERLNGIHELDDPKDLDSIRTQDTEEFYAALEEAQLKRKLPQSWEQTYVSNYTMNDYNEMSLASRRSSQEPEPDPPPDETNLKRAISCGSLSSETSLISNDIQDAPNVGQICVSIQYGWSGRSANSDSLTTSHLTISVLEARQLRTNDGQLAKDTYARVCLSPDFSTPARTRVYKNSPSPSYQESFQFPLLGTLNGRILHVEVFSDESSKNGGDSFIGKATLKLESAPRVPATTWLHLFRLAELKFSLSYLPTAERLSLIILKAKNLRGAGLAPGDFYVKVYLLKQGRKMYKQSTSVKRGEDWPIFNERIIFTVPPHMLQHIQLRLTVAETNSERANTKSYSVGHVIIGSNTKGRSLDHWNQMLTTLRRPVSMWHPLEKYISEDVRDDNVGT